MAIHAFNWWIPLFALAGFAVVLPPWTYFVSAYSTDLPMVAQFFAHLSLPTLVVLFLVSWFDPG